MTVMFFFNSLILIDFYTTINKLGAIQYITGAGYTGLHVSTPCPLSISGDLQVHCNDSLPLCAVLTPLSSDFIEGKKLMFYKSMKVNMDSL